MIYVLLSLLSGLFGRMGGAGKHGHWYDFLLHTLWRDLGCSAIVVAVLWMNFGFHPIVYSAVFLLHWGAFSTYWDKLFGYDNMWFSGGMVGLALAPIIFIDISLWWIVLCRIIILTVAWGCLNKYLPAKVLCWKRDVAEEYSRYAISL